MRITGYESSEAVRKELGARIRAYRLSKPETQQELAERAGVSLRTLQNMEAGNDIKMGSIVRVLRALGLAANLDLLVPASEPRPMDNFMLGKERERARKTKTDRGKPGNLPWPEVEE